MNANPHQSVSDERNVDPTGIVNAITTNVSTNPSSSRDVSESSTLNGDHMNKSTSRDSTVKNVTKRVKILDPDSQHYAESDEEDTLSQPGSTLDRVIPVVTGESGTLPTTQGLSTDGSQAAAADKKKTKEERKKEREKKKEEEMLKKYQAEQDAKQRVAAKSKCGRWIKHNLKREHVDTKEKSQAMYRETEIMLKMTHPHIVRCFDVFREWIDMEDPKNQIEEKGVVIIQELMGEGTLKSVIRKTFSEGQCILKFPLITRWWHQILDALRYMHHKIQPPILHRDLKADNCFLYKATDEEYLNLKVGDFGLATHVNNSGRKTMLGTLGFMAPEIFDEKYDEKVDIYAFGMLMLEVMTNRTPYDECETVMQVAAKTMSGQGPDIMEMVLNSAQREVISACIQPLTCFRPTAEELYFHPLFQPKTLPVEVEPNYDNNDRAEVLDRFVRSLDNPETRNPKFNLRLRFRDKKMLQELGLDDGESLEFDLDIYKAEDQDIPELIHNLRFGYEDKLWRVFENPKQPDKKIVSSHLDKLFSSIRLQMQFLVKVLLGKRWKAILESLVKDQPNRKRPPEGTSSTVDEDDSDLDGRETSSFTTIGKYKSKWTRAKRLLDREIQAYRKATNAATSATPIVTTTNSESITATNPTATVNPSSAVPFSIHRSGTSSNGNTEAKMTIAANTTGTLAESIAPGATLTPLMIPSVGTQMHGSQLASSFPSEVEPNASQVPLKPSTNIAPTISVTTSTTTATINAVSATPTGIIGPGNPQPAPVDQASTSAIIAGIRLPHPVDPSLLPQFAPGISTTTSPAAPGPASTLPSSATGTLGASAIAPTCTVSSSPSSTSLSSSSSSSSSSTATATSTVMPPRLIPVVDANLPPGSHAFDPVAKPPIALQQVLMEHGMAGQVTGHGVGEQLTGAPSCSQPAIPHSQYTSNPSTLTNQSTGFVGQGAPFVHPNTQAQYLPTAVTLNSFAEQLTHVITNPNQPGQPPQFDPSVLGSLLAGALTHAPQQNDRKVRRKSKSKPRYVLRVVSIDRDVDSNGEPAFRPTFRLEVPDFNNPNCEKWKLNFCCNVTDTLDDFRLDHPQFQGSGYKSMNEDIDRAAKEAVLQMLEALRADMNSIKLNQDYEFYLPPVMPNTSLLVTAPSDATVTGTHDEEDESSETSRPLSPDAMTSAPYMPAFQLPIGQPDSKTSYITAATGIASSIAYQSVSSQASCNIAAGHPAQSTMQQFPNPSLIPPQHVPTDGMDLNTALRTQGGQYVNEFWPTRGTVPDTLTTGATNGFQSGQLEEVVPLGALTMSDPPLTGMQSTNIEPHSNVHTTTDPPDQRQPHPVDALLTQPSHLSWTNNSTRGSLNLAVPSSQPPQSDPLITLTFTVPASLESVLREIACRLCTTPNRNYVFLPTSVSPVGVTPKSQTGPRVVEIPPDHIFLGVPNPMESSSECNLTTFKAPNEAAFIMLDDPHLVTEQNKSLCAPRIYRAPTDTAVILDPNGTVYCLDKPALVVPSGAIHHSLSPPCSPVSELTDAHIRSNQTGTGSVQVRELPIHPFVDTLTLDDVLKVLLALRSTAQPQRSNTASPSAPMAMNTHLSMDSHSISCAASRRSSATVPSGAPAANTISGYGPLSSSSLQAVPYPPGARLPRSVHSSVGVQHDLSTAPTGSSVAYGHPGHHMPLVPTGNPPPNYGMPPNNSIAPQPLNQALPSRPLWPMSSSLPTPYLQQTQHQPQQYHHPVAAVLPSMQQPQQQQPMLSAMGVVSNDPTVAPLHALSPSVGDVTANILAMLFNQLTGNCSITTAPIPTPYMNRPPVLAAVPSPPETASWTAVQPIAPQNPSQPNQQSSGIGQQLPTPLLSRLITQPCSAGVPERVTAMPGMDPTTCRTHAALSAVPSAPGPVRPSLIPSNQTSIGSGSDNAQCHLPATLVSAVASGTIQPRVTQTHPVHMQPTQFVADAGQTPPMQSATGQQQQQLNMYFTWLFNSLRSMQQKPLDSTEVMESLPVNRVIPPTYPAVVIPTTIMSGSSANSSGTSIMGITKQNPQQQAVLLGGPQVMPPTAPMGTFITPTGAVVMPSQAVTTIPTPNPPYSIPDGMISGAHLTEVLTERTAQPFPQVKNQNSSTTVANKFTVVAVHSENDEPAPPPATVIPSVSASGTLPTHQDPAATMLLSQFSIPFSQPSQQHNQVQQQQQWIQTPPRPPRQPRPTAPVNTPVSLDATTTVIDAGQSVADASAAPPSVVGPAITGIGVKQVPAKYTVEPTNPVAMLPSTPCARTGKHPNTTPLSSVPLSAVNSTTAAMSPDAVVTSVSTVLSATQSHT